MQTLKRDKDLTILPADKGRATVMLGRPDYISKYYEHINNGPYKRLNNDPIESIKREARNNKG